MTLRESRYRTFPHGWPFWPFLTSRVWLIDVTPLANSPATVTLNAVVATVTECLDQFRADWWKVYGTTDLINRWIRVEDLAAGPLVVELSRWRKGANQVTAASYEPTTRALSLVTRDGPRFELPAGSGRME